MEIVFFINSHTINFHPRMRFHLIVVLTRAKFDACINAASQQQPPEHQRLFQTTRANRAVIGSNSHQVRNSL